MEFLQLDDIIASSDFFLLQVDNSMFDLFQSNFSLGNRFLFLLDNALKLLEFRVEPTKRSQLFLELNCRMCVSVLRVKPLLAQSPEENRSPDHAYLSFRHLFIEFLQLHAHTLNP